MSKNDYRKLVNGLPINCVIRIKPQNSSKKDDINVKGNLISLLDSQNETLEQYQNDQIYNESFGIENMYQETLQQHVDAFMQGHNLSVFNFGSSGSGKSSTLEGSKRDAGFKLLFADQIFNILENKLYQNQHQINPSGNSYSYLVRMRYVEIYDEEIIDLLAQNQYSSENQVVYDEWEGPTVSNGVWVTIQTSQQFTDVFYNGKMQRLSGTNEFGRISSKSASVLTIEVIQIDQLLHEQTVVLISRASFFDLPSCDALTEDQEVMRTRQGGTLNKGIIAISNVIKDCVSTRSGYVFYESSLISFLMKDCFGGNSITLGIFNIQQGDIRGSSLTLYYMKQCQSIMNFPIVNDSKAIGLLRKLRAEIIVIQNNKTKIGGSDDNQYNMRVVELEKKIIEENLDKMRYQDDKFKLNQKLKDIRDKYNNLLKSKQELQGELISCEEEKLSVSQQLVEIKIENTKLMELMQNEKYDTNNKLLNAEGELQQYSLKEQKLLNSYHDLQEKFHFLMEEKREIEIEFISVKKCFIQANQKIALETEKNEKIGLELINLTNENKALHEEINDIYKKSGNTSEENAKFILRLEKYERENHQLKETLVFSKAEIERLKTEGVKYEILFKQNEIELEKRKMELEKEFLETTKHKSLEMHTMTKQRQMDTKQLHEQKQLWESQILELQNKIKLYQRKTNELDERISELSKLNEDLSIENNKTNIQMDEMRQVFRQKLMQYMNEKRQEGNQIGFDLSAREELLRTYKEKEVEQREKLDHEKMISQQSKMEIRVLKNYVRNLKNLAEDWAPQGVSLPDILTKPPPIDLSDQSSSQQVRDLQNQLEQQQRLNRNMEAEIRQMQDMVMQNGKKTDSNDNIQQRLINEIEFLKGSNLNFQRPQSSSQNTESLRNERNELQEENRRLVQMLKDNKKWDLNLIQREKEQLQKMVRDLQLNNSQSPQSGENSKSFSQKIEFYEKTLRIAEKERSELIIRCTMAEEQLSNLQDHLTKSTADYQRKIKELQKQIKIGN